MNDKVEIRVELSVEEAWALHDFLKRVQPIDFQRRAADTKEAFLMHDAAIEIKAALRRAGVASH